MAYPSPRPAPKPKPKKKPKPKALPKPPARVRRLPGEMTTQAKAFINYYVVDFNGQEAAIKAGYSAKSARFTASKLLARDDVAQAVKERMAQVAETTGINAERVLQEAWGIATADVNDLVEFRRGCCRHCHGIDFGFQRTMQEDSAERKDYNNARTKAVFKDPTCEATYEAYDEKGGIGFDARLPPNPECTSCWGDGVGQAHFKDTRTLTKEARALYAGVKQTKDGYQMLLIDKAAGLEKLFKHFGLYKVDNEQKADSFKEFLEAIHSKGGGKLPIKGA